MENRNSLSELFPDVDGVFCLYCKWWNDLPQFERYCSDMRIKHQRVVELLEIALEGNGRVPYVCCRNPACEGMVYVSKMVEPIKPVESVE